MVSDVWHAIFDLLGAKDLVILSQTSKAMRQEVKRYRTIAFSIGRLLSPFIPYESISSFRNVLESTGGIISGSTALRFMDRATFFPTDLNIYVFLDKAIIIEEWLLHQGLTRSMPEEEVDVADHYRKSSDIKGVHNFKVSIEASRIVQIILTRRNPILAILTFHSSMSSLVFKNDICSKRLKNSMCHEFHNPCRRVFIISHVDFF